jgi:hypothetical protein
MMKMERCEGCQKVFKRMKDDFLFCGECVMGKRTVEWFLAKENEFGIETIGLESIDEYGDLHRIIGYNGILKGDKVKYQDVEYTVVMVSRMGHFGLSDTGQLPYTKSVYPNEVKGG